MIDHETLAAEIRQRIEQAAAERERRRQHTAAVRAQFAEARRHGLAARHRQRMARAEQRLRQARRDGAEDSWWEEPQP
jgi:hypothetical protein